MIWCSCLQLDSSTFRKIIWKDPSVVSLHFVKVRGPASSWLQQQLRGKGEGTSMVMVQMTLILSWKYTVSLQKAEKKLWRYNPTALYPLHFLDYNLESHTYHTQFKNILTHAVALSLLNAAGRSYFYYSHLDWSRRKWTERTVSTKKQVWNKIWAQIRGRRGGGGGSDAAKSTCFIPSSILLSYSPPPLLLRPHSQLKLRQSAN